MPVHKSQYRTIAISKLDEILNERSSNRAIRYNHVAQFSGIISRLGNSTNAIGILHSRPNPTETSAMHVKRLASASVKLKKQAEKEFDALNDILAQRIGALQSIIDKKLNLNENKFGPEIRDAFRRMSREDQHKMLKRLADEGKGPEIAAIIAAPAILSGIPETEQKNYIERMTRKHCPAEFAEQLALNDDARSVLSALNVANECAADFEHSKLLSEIEKLERSAEAAEAAFNASAQAAISQL